MEIKTWNLTGFGEEYEDMTQRMLWQGVKFLLDNNIKKFNTTGFKGIYGLIVNEGELGEKFDEAMTAGIDGYTGAMHQCATEHAKYIALNGYDKWYEYLKDHREPEDAMVYEFDGEILKIGVHR